MFTHPLLFFFSVFLVAVFSVVFELSVTSTLRKYESSKNTWPITNHIYGATCEIEFFDTFHASSIFSCDLAKSCELDLMIDWRKWVGSLAFAVARVPMAL